MSLVPPPALLDTDTLSFLTRQEPQVVNHAQAYVAVHGRLTISLITRYEILRGLKAKGANVQAAAFEKFCAANTILPLTDDIIVRAADLYADLHRRGLLIGDADILIAATALENGLTLVTNNENHFRRLPGLVIMNWRV